MKEKNEIKKNTVQMVRASILQVEKDNGIELSDEKIIAEIGATTMKDMGAIMKEAKAKMGASADGKTINEVAKEIMGL